MRKKWMVAATVLPVLVFVTLFLLGRETFHAEITMEATPEEVWSVLTDAPGYAAWNPCSSRSAAISAKARRSSTE